MFRIRRMAVTSLVGTLLATVSVGVTPASATVAEGYIAGTGKISNDWNDEGVLSEKQHTRTKAVGLWQRVLWAERATINYGMGGYRTFALSDIDCVYGADTASATDWLQTTQSNATLTADGSAGPVTMDYFAHKLKDVGSYNSDFELLSYVGRQRAVNFLRHKVTGAYLFEDANGNWTTASYTKPDC